MNMSLSLVVDSSQNENLEIVSNKDDVDSTSRSKKLLVLRKHGDKLMILKRSRRLDGRRRSYSLLADGSKTNRQTSIKGRECELEDDTEPEEEVIDPLREQTSLESDSDCHSSSGQEYFSKKHYSSVCDVCGLKFKGDNALIAHRKWKHTNVVKHECVFCFKTFRDSFCLKRHLRSVHTESGDIRENYRSINCSLCEFKAAEGSLVSKHYANAHGFEMVEEKIRFSSIMEFEEWKKEMESGTSTKYVKFRGSRTNRNGTTVTIYNCHRSGYYHASTKGKDKRLRTLKSKGSNKINGFCPATISCIEYNGQVIVKFMMTHIGHDLDLEKIGLTKEEKDFIAEKLSSSIPMDKILEDLKESATNAEDKRRLHVATRKDFYNIIDKYNLKGLAIYSQSKDEWKKFDSWVRELEESSNAVRFYKPQGKVVHAFSEFKTEDFCLIMASDAQLELLKLYGNQCICVDNVYKENTNDFELHTVVVLDDLRESFPCAFIFSNRADDNALRAYFQVIKSFLQVELSPRYFVSDWANSIFNAWTSVNRELPCKNLFSKWHIQKEWKRNLPKIKPKEKQIEIFKKVEELLTVRDYSVFEEKSSNVLAELFNNFETKTYANYIQKIICEPLSWAYCFRMNADINDCLNLDELHCNIEYFHVKGKKVKCLTKTAQALMSYATNRINLRFDVAFQENINRKIDGLRYRHQLSSEMQESIIEITEQGWNVQSNSSDDQCKYSVFKEDVDCTCSLICPECMACIHAYRCTCQDSLDMNMCKHVHLIATCIQNHTIMENMDATAEIVEVQMESIEEREIKCEIEDLSDDDDNNMLEDTHIGSPSSEVCNEIYLNCDDENDSSNNTHFAAKKCEFIERLTHIVNGIETEAELDAVILQNSPLEEILQSVKGKNKSDTNGEELEEPPNKKMYIKEEPLFSDDDGEGNNAELFDENIQESEQIALEVIVE